MTPPEAFRHFLMIHYSSYCLLTPPEYFLLLFCARLQQHQNINKQTQYCDSESHTQTLKQALLKELSADNFALRDAKKQY